jgi:HK97 family phage portal protein
MKDLAVNKVKKEKTVFELIDQSFKIPKDLQLLKASTMKINYDETGKVASYQQDVKGTKRIYRPEDIIHLSLINVGGEPYGFSPIEPLLSDIGTLIFAKEYAGKFFENDGVPNYIFVMPNEHPDSPNYKKFKTELKQLKDKASKYRNLVLTGELTIQQVQKFSKDLEFSKLIQHFTQLVLIGLGVPSHRIHYAGISEKTQGSQTNRALEGYYKRISFLQKIIEETMNVDLFEVFNVDLKFNAAYKIDSMRQAQIVQILSQINSITVSEAREMMGLDPDLPEGDMPMATGDQNNIDFQQDKKTQQGQDNNAQRPDKNTDNKMKSVFKAFDDCVDVTFAQLQIIVERFTGEAGFNKAKIVYSESEDFFVIYFNDGTWKYRSIVDKRMIDAEAFRVEKLTYAVKMQY